MLFAWMIYAPLFVPLSHAKARLLETLGRVLEFHPQPVFGVGIQQKYPNVKECPYVVRFCQGNPHLWH